MAAQIEKMGRRYYLRDAPYSARRALKGAGCKWDPEQRAWWTGKKDRAEELLSQLSDAPARSEGIARDDRVIRGRAKYQGRTYRLLWAGTTRRGTEAARLATMDGSRVFWCDLAEVTIEREYREVRSLADLERFRARGQFHGPSCRCEHPLDEGDGECMLCGYYIYQ